LRNLIRKIAEKISRTNNYTRDEEEQVEYGLRVFIFETLKIIGAIIVFSLLGYPQQAAVAIGTMSIVKPFIGGYHEDSQIKCFMFTLLLIGSVIYLSNSLSVNFIDKLILSSISLYCIWQQAPVMNPSMQITRVDLIKRNRVVGVSISIVVLLISMIFYRYTLVSNSILWTMVFQTLLMFNKKSK
jgi:accessory gene regulator B